MIFYKFNIWCELGIQGKTFRFDLAYFKDNENIKKIKIWFLFYIMFNPFGLNLFNHSIVNPYNRRTK